MNSYYMVLNKNLVGRLKGYDDTFSLSIIELIENRVLVKVTNGTQACHYTAEAVATMDFEVIKNRQDGIYGTKSKALLGFLLP